MNDDMGEVGRDQKNEHLKWCIGQSRLIAIINNCCNSET